MSQTCQRDKLEETIQLHRLACKRDTFRERRKERSIDADKLWLLFVVIVVSTFPAPLLQLQLPVASDRFDEICSDFVWRQPKPYLFGFFCF